MDWRARGAFPREVASRARRTRRDGTTHDDEACGLARARARREKARR